MDKIKDIFDMLKDMGKALKDVPKVLLSLLEALPLLAQALVFLVTKLPKQIGDVFTEIIKFFDKAKTLYIAIIVLIVAIFIGIQFLVIIITGVNLPVPPIVLILISIFVVVGLVLNNTNDLKTFQTQILNIKVLYDNFAKKATPIIVPVILLFFILIIGFRYLIKFITGSPSTIPIRILILLSIYIIYIIVMFDNTYLKLAQDYLLLGFIYLFNHPAVKEIVKFNVKIDKDKPLKSSDDIAKWILLNIPAVIITLIIVAVVVKIFITKIISYINELIK